MGVIRQTMDTSTACQIYLLRHGRTESNTAGRLMGQLDEPLAELGRTQADLAGRSLRGRNIAAVYASDLRRASDTAEIVAEQLGLTVVRHSGLREINMGDWAGKTYAEVQSTDAATYAAVRANPHQSGPRNGESEGEMIERVWRALGEIAAAHPGESVLVVSHGGPLRAVTARVLGLGHLSSGTFAVDNCGILLLEWAGDTQRLLVPSPVAG